MFSHQLLSAWRQLNYDSGVLVFTCAWSALRQLNYDSGVLVYICAWSAWRQLNYDSGVLVYICAWSAWRQLNYDSGVLVYTCAWFAYCMLSCYACSGRHREVWPVYGEYHYLNAPRYIHGLEVRGQLSSRMLSVCNADLDVYSVTLSVRACVRACVCACVRACDSVGWVCMQLVDCTAL